MRTLASLEGVIEIDNRHNPGVPVELAVANGLPAGAARGRFEEVCYTCGHCERQVVKNRERTRPRGYCPKCQHVICDACDQRYHASGHQCIPFKAFAEEVRNAAARGAADPVAEAEAYFQNIRR